MSQLSSFLERNIGSGKKAPEWSLDFPWLNTERPLSLAALRGKIVLLDFWTFCCINCMHVLPDLKRLENKYRNELVVIGVHSAKFDHEQILENIRQSLLRYEVAHPVVKDEGMTIWRAYGVNAWPTLMLIDPAGNLVFQTSGEGQYELLDNAIQELIRIYEPTGKLDRTPLSLRLERDREESGFLKFPGKVRVREGQLVISDTNHNRILLSDLSGKVTEVIEGPLFHPQGAELEGDSVYIADTENHAIRVYERNRRAFKTLGEKLNSPWDLVKRGELIFIAMAGAHQIWVLELSSGALYPFAGSGREGLIDGPLQGAALAQPSGIATDGRSALYVADSEVSGVRKIDLVHRQVETLIGRGLFVFGDQDGIWEEALLQHPLGIDFYEGKIYLADSYNHKVKELDLAGRKIRTLPGVQGGRPFFSEPGGLAVTHDQIFVADTNRHAIRVFNLKTEQLTTLPLH